MKKILFGAGKFGKYAIEKYGRDEVAFFVDNNQEKVGEFEGKKVISFTDFLKMYVPDKYKIVITVKNTSKIEQQLTKAGIFDYDLYSEDEFAYYPTKQLIVNTYEFENSFINNSEENINRLISEIDMLEKQYSSGSFLFNHVELETINRCNGTCSFCPVNALSDKRPYKMMSEKLFYKIINELEEMRYSGKIALFSNNEPLLDDRIIDFHKYTREHLPYARMHLFTNGTLLTLEKFKLIIPYLDELIIDNYSQNLKLIPNSLKIVEYCENNPELKSKVTVVLRKRDEVLSTRGGDAPNARIISYPYAKCILPFKQMIIRPDGKVSLCCNDPLGKNTLGDVNTQSLVEVWEGEGFASVRKALHSGRGNWEHCEFCDAFLLG